MAALQVVQAAQIPLYTGAEIVEHHVPRREHLTNAHRQWIRTHIRDTLGINDYRYHSVYQTVIDHWNSIRTLSREASFPQALNS